MTIEETKIRYPEGFKISLKHNNYKHLVDKKFGRLTVLKYLGRAKMKCGDYEHFILSKCDCGAESINIANQVAREHVRSCGCFYKESRKSVNFTHGLSYTPTYGSWFCMKQRCLNFKHKEYPNYGGRGIKICDRWLGDNGFNNFITDLGMMPKGFSIERRNVDLDYTPENCCYIDKRKQAWNKRNSVYFYYNGKRINSEEAAALTGISRKTLGNRYRNWDLSNPNNIDLILSRKKYAKKKYRK